jgi:ATP-dependent Lhr-like helicase
MATATTTGSEADAAALAPFHPLVRRWFAGAFGSPTPAQVAGWPPIAAGENALILAPTGSGKTLAAFLWGLNTIIADRIENRPAGRLLYISPLKALNYDVERNLDAPLAGIAAVAERAGMRAPPVSVAVRTGDTPARERRRMLRTPPDILITTPESLYLLLTSRGREMLADVRTVIVDEIHAVAGTKRGAHLALSMERLERAVRAGGGRLQRIGLSATQRPLDEIARFLGGHEDDGSPRPVAIADAGAAPDLDLRVVVPVDDMRVLPDAQDGQGAQGPGSENRRRSIWPAMYPELLQLIRAHRSTLLFVNNRRLAERLALRLNELAEDEVALAHHGSLARERRTLIEERLKAGDLKALVATSSLELGIDMGAIDLVIQVESPRSVARGLQRVGRAGHQRDTTSRGRIFPTHRGDLAECAAVVANMRAGAIEPTHIPALPLDVLAQQIVATCAERTWTVDDLHALARGAAPYADLSREQLEGVLDMLAGRYPGDELAELRPRVVWDRVAGTVRGRDGAQRLAVQNAGTIPDQGLYAVVLPDGGRVGELDEEMVYEARSGQTFMLGASSWRIEEITRDRVVVTPAPGAPGSLPFWKGDGLGRPLELGEAVGRLSRELLAAPVDAAARRLADESAFDARAAGNLLTYLREQEAATGTVPSDRAVVVERFRDEVGDWRICVLSPFGARVHAPWAMAVAARVRAATGQEAHAIWSDDGIALHLPEADEPPSADLVLIDPEEVEELVVGELGNTALFGASFRQNAARALMIPRRRPGQRTPLWQQRLKAQNLLQVARRFGSFPIVLETYRECLNDRFDMAGLRGLLTRIRTRELAVVEVETPTASPFAGSLLFAYVASFMYDDDTPVGERRAHALSLNRDLLRELLGHEELRDLIDAGALAELEDDLQGLSERMRARGTDGLHDLLRRIGDLSDAEIAARLRGPADAPALVDQLVRERRAARVRVAGEERVIAAEDAGRYRDALGAMPPGGLPAAFLERVDDALAGLIARFARSHGPFHARDAAARFGLEADEARAVLARLEEGGGLVRGELRPGGSGREWCDADVVRRLRQASLAAARREIAPVEAAELGRFLPRWHGIDRPEGAGAAESLRRALVPLVGLPLPPAQWEGEVLPRRCRGYAPSLLDELAARGEIVWVGAGSGGVGGGRVAIYFREDAPLLGPPPADPAPGDPVTVALRAALAAGGGFWEEILGAVGAPREEVFTALWSLVWAGEVTNDMWLPLRAPRRLPPLQRPTVGRRRRGVPRWSAPSAVAGRWSLTARLFADAAEPAERLRAAAELLVERHGVLTRPAVLSEGTTGGFAALYPALRDLETLGACRRGYFIAGLGGAQFAAPGAVERLRDGADAGGEIPEAVILGAADPAQPFGAAAPWPATTTGRTPARVFGAQVVLLDGAPVLYLERGGRGLVTFGPPEPRWTEPALAALAAWMRADRGRRRAIERVDGAPAHESALLGALAGAGFRTDLRGVAPGA